MLKTLDDKGVPLVIISANGLGVDSIRLILEKNDCMYSNIEIVSNRLKWDKEGYFIGAEKPYVHSANKNETVMKELPFYEAIKSRQNVI